MTLRLRLLRLPILSLGWVFRRHPGCSLSFSKPKGLSDGPVGPSAKAVGFGTRCLRSPRASSAITSRHSCTYRSYAIVYIHELCYYGPSGRLARSSRRFCFPSTRSTVSDLPETPSGHGLCRTGHRRGRRYPDTKVINYNYTHRHLSPMCITISQRVENLKFSTTNT